ncbi:amino acid--[acyl-carrier-protein] ligase [soil metagenome]
MDAPVSFLDQLFAAGLLINTGVPGLYGRGGVFEDVIMRFEALVTREGNTGAEIVRFPPGMNQTHFARSGYLKSFPQLAGAVHSFCGDSHAHAALLSALEGGGDWSAQLASTDVALTPATCYPLYPIVAGRGPLAADGALFDLQSYCFRHEPSADPARMQMFRQREFVRIGSAEQVLDFRQDWLQRGQALINRLGLPYKLEIANDPFFGRGGKLMAVAQREQQLKFELLVPISSEAHATACLSFNYHQEHFGQTWGIVTAEGETAHTACVGFGLERIALALFKHHGLSVEAWPRAVRETLWG